MEEVILEEVTDDVAADGFGCFRKRNDCSLSGVKLFALPQCPSALQSVRQETQCLRQTSSIRVWSSDVHFIGGFRLFMGFDLTKTELMRITGLYIKTHYVKTGSSGVT